MNFSGSEDLWLLIGDFNSILGAHETTGNISSLPCDEFHAMILVLYLVEIETREVFYTQIGRGRNDIDFSRLTRLFSLPPF